MWKKNAEGLPVQGCDVIVGWKRHRHLCEAKPVLVRRFRIMERGVSCLHAEYFCEKHKQLASKHPRSGETDVEVLNFPVE